MARVGLRLKTKVYATMAELILNNVHKSFGNVAAVRGASFRVPAGQLAVLVGPSGCGKTTTLRLIAGLERPDQGEMRLDGRDLGPLPSHERGVGMVFQSPALYPHMTVEQNLAFALRLSHAGADEIRRRVTEAAKTLGLDELLNRRPDELSGGQQQRVSLGKAVVRNTGLWLLDEPLASLDAPLRRQLGQEIAALQKKTGTTTLFVTHDQSEALAYADWLIVMDRGKVQQVGPPAEVYDRPANRFVASFLGDPPMNMLHGEALNGRFRAGDILLDLPVEAADGPVVVGIRPEDISPADGGGDSGMQATVQSIEFRGHDVAVGARIGDRTLLLRSPSAARLAIGASLEITLRRERLHVFDSGVEGEKLCGPP